jgi:hypothetical protein
VLHEPPDKAGGDLLTESQWGSWPELDSGRRRELPHGGCQLSSEFRDSSHGDGLTEGLDSVRRWVRLGIVLLRHHGYPGSGPSMPEVTPLLPALFLIISTVVTMLLELFGLEEEEEGSDLSSLRVQTPLYRLGSGYRLGGRLPSCRLLRGCVFSVILWPLTPRLTVATL